MTNSVIGSTPQGYTCAVCGIFVPDGYHHICSGTPTHPVISTHDAAMLRIATAMERIAAALEAEVSR